jgi:hypothetical protein
MKPNNLLSKYLFTLEDTTDNAIRYDYLAGTVFNITTLSWGYHSGDYEGFHRRGDLTKLHVSEGLIAFIFRIESYKSNKKSTPTGLQARLYIQKTVLFFKLN